MRKIKIYVLCFLQILLIALEQIRLYLYDSVFHTATINFNPMLYACLNIVN